MWKRGSRSSALDRAKALLSAETRGGRAAQGSGQESAAKAQLSVGESFTSRSAPRQTQNFFADLSDVSSVSSASESGSEAGQVTDAEKSYGRESDSKKDLRPQSSLGGGSRFLKKAPAPTKSSQSPVSRNQMHPGSEPRLVSSARRVTHTVTEPAETEASQETKPALSLTSDLGISPPAAARVLQSSEASMQLQPGSAQSLRGSRFLKKKAAESTNTSPPAATKRVDASVRSRAAAASEGLERQSVRLMSGVSLDSDEEDMRKLLGDSMDSTDFSFLRPGRPSSLKKPDEGVPESSLQAHAAPPPQVLPPPPCSSAPPRSPASSHRSSPFRFTGHAQARFSPSVPSPPPSPPPSPSPSPPCVSPSLLERPGSSSRPEIPQRSLSSASGRGEVLSLEELFPVDSGSERPHSEMSSVSSEDFRVNVMTLDDLAPARLGFTAAAHEREAQQGSPAAASSDRSQQLQEELPDYQSDFESDGKAEPDEHSADQVSEHLQQVVSDVPHERTEDAYSSAFSDTSQRSTSLTSDRRRTSRPCSRSRSEDSRSSHERRASSQQSRRRRSARTGLKEAAVQTQPDPLASTWPTGAPTVDPTVAMAYMNLSPVVTQTVSAEMVEALSTFNPAVFALNELLKQQLAMTRRFIESSRRLHASLLQSLEPPNYRYTTLEDTKKFIYKHRRRKL